MRLRGSERSGTFDGWTPEPVEVPKRLSEVTGPPLWVPVDFLPGDTEGDVPFVGCPSVGCLSVGGRSLAAKGA